MTSATGTRIGWADLPCQVRAGVEAIVGDTVVRAVSQPGGFSPGTADRIRTAAGRRAFVKAVSPTQNEVSTDLHRREAHVTAALPEYAPTPRLLGCYDDGYWVALVLQDVEGRHPRTPWRPDELEAVLTTLGDLAVTLTPSPLPGVPSAVDHLSGNFAGWRRVAADPPPDLDPWTSAHLPVLCALADQATASLAGDTLVHNDIRADNLLLRPDGAAVVVDWPWACVGPAWLDTLLLMVNVRLFGGHDTDALLTDTLVSRRAAMTELKPDDLTAVLAGLAGFFLDCARQPPPPGIPTLRAFQRAQADAVLPWVRDRLTTPGSRRARA
ncbi:aminoglycoside phosphotransferase family protein [Planosporangium mesophilum]|nr:aminoglycoside phosphotransferase family protein [Planosporangium mesophilum]NJC84348.1 aminoglycoside phosphotransferase family protein [Planosporangium mesophilum]